MKMLVIGGAGFAALITGAAMVTGAIGAEGLRHFSETPTSAYVVAGLIPAMLLGQLAATRKRSRR